MIDPHGGCVAGIRIPEANWRVVSVRRARYFPEGIAGSNPYQRQMNVRRVIRIWQVNRGSRNIPWDRHTAREVALAIHLIRLPVKLESAGFHFRKY